MQYSTHLSHATSSASRTSISLFIARALSQ
jgi:hypothetical protein